MSVSFKSPATSDNLNQAFLDKNKDTETSFKLKLSRAASGATVNDVQQAINDNATAISDVDNDLVAHEGDFTAHIKYDTKANLDTWALTAANGARAFATDEKLAYQVVDGLLVEFGGGGGIAEWVTLGGYDIGDVVWLAADNKIYRCTVANNDAAFTPANWQELSENPLEGFVSVNAQDNVIVTDSNDTIVIDNEKGVLYRTRFKEILPSALFADVGNVTTDDKTVSPFYGGLTAIIEQASASVNDGAGFIIDFTFANREIDWQNRSLKILIKNKAVGNDGDYRFKVSLSNGSYREVSSSAINVGVNFTEIVITTNSDDIALKIEALVVTPNDSATLEIGEISVVDDFLVTGQLLLRQSVYRTGLASTMTSSTSGVLRWGSLNDIGSSILSYNDATGLFLANRDCSAHIASSARSGSIFNLYIENGAGSINYATERDGTGGNHVSIACNINLIKGDTFRIRTDANLDTIRETPLTILAYSQTDAVVSEDASNLNTNLKANNVSSTSFTVDVTNIPFTEVNDTKSEYTSPAFVPKETGIYAITSNLLFTTTGQRQLILYNNGVGGTPIGKFEDSLSAGGTITAELIAGRSYTVRVTGAAGTIASTSSNLLYITREAKRNINFGGNNGDYFTAEHKTGQKWIDGRDVYRRAYQGSGSFTATIPIETIQSGLEVVNFGGSVKIGASWRPHTYDDGTTAYRTDYLDTGEFRVAIGGSVTITDYLLFIEYVKP